MFFSNDDSIWTGFVAEKQQIVLNCVCVLITACVSVSSISVSVYVSSTRTPVRADQYSSNQGFKSTFSVFISSRQ